jgi:hypothetical protein
MSIEQDFENLPPATEKKAANKKLVVFVSIFGAVLILLLAVSIFTGFNQKESGQPMSGESTPTPTTEVKQEIGFSSPYATDAALLKIEEEVENLDKKIQTTDLKETALTPPVLEMGVDFKE